MMPSSFSDIGKIRKLLLPTEQRNGMILLVMMLAGVGLETLGVGLFIPALSILTQKNFTPDNPFLQKGIGLLGNPGQHELVVGGVLVLEAVYLAKALYLGLLAWMQNRFTFGIGARLSLQLYASYLHQPYTFHLQRNSAQLIRNATNEVGIFTGSVLSPLMQLFSESLIVASLGMMLLLVEPAGTLAIVIVLGFGVWQFTRLTKKPVMEWGKTRQFHEGQRIQHLQQGLGGAKDVKLLGREEDFIGRYRRHNAESAKVGRLYATVQQLPKLWLELMAVTGLATLVIVMLAHGMGTEAIMPQLGLFAVVTFRLMPAVNRLLYVTQCLKYCMPVLDILEADIALGASNPTTRPARREGFRSSIELRDVRYTYPRSGHPAIDTISLIVNAGESVGFIGTSGAGKSTLVDILLGLLPPDEGFVAVDGRDIRHGLREWQRQIGYVPQSIFLTDDTLLRNIAFGLPDRQVSEAAVWKALRAAHLDDFARTLPDGLATMVGERGIRLSGGQRQRIGIARALYHDPAILVLDEATSALDAATEKGVMDAVRELQGSKTVIIVAHRTSTVSHCDRLYRLENGRIQAQGRPEALLAAGKNGSVNGGQGISFEEDGQNLAARQPNGK